MAKQIYEVRGTYTITVLKRVKANDEQEALELAERHFSGITEYCGNGGYDKLVGVDNDSESVEAEDYIEWQEAYETDDDRYDERTDSEFRTYICNLCGESFECEDDDDFDRQVIYNLWDHMEIEHSYEYEECKDWSDLELIKKYFEEEYE